MAKREKAKRQKAKRQKAKREMAKRQKAKRQKAKRQKTKRQKAKLGQISVLRFLYFGLMSLLVHSVFKLLNQGTKVSKQLSCEDEKKRANGLKRKYQTFKIKLKTTVQLF